jgi:hypothetical protein
MFETAGLLAIDLLYIVAHLATGCVYLFWDELPRAASSLVAVCLSNPSSPILLSMLKLHCLVMVCFVLAICFRLTTAADVQHVVDWPSAINHTLNVSLVFEIARQC